MRLTCATLVLWGGLFGAVNGFAQPVEPVPDAPGGAEQQEDDELTDQDGLGIEGAQVADPFDEFRQFEEQEAADQQDAGRPLELMTRDDLANAGFQFGTNAAARDTSSALLLAVTVGTAVHGIGHFYLGDPKTGWFLLGMEAASVGLMIASTTFFGLTESASPWSALFAPMLQAGLAGFVFSYLADVLGTVTKDAGGLEPNTSAAQGVGILARYGLLSSAGIPVRHVIDAELIADIGGIYGRGATTQDVFLDLASYRGGLGGRPLRGRNPLTYLGLEANAEYLQWQGDGEFGRIGADGRLVLSVQLGDDIAHLSEFAMGVTAGLGNHWVQIAPQGSTTFDVATSRIWVPFDVWASLNVTSRLNVRGGYGSPELFLVPPIHRLLGVAHVEFTYRSSAYGDISLRAEIGDGFALWLGGALWLGR